MQFLWVGLGGFIGSVLRFGLTGLIHRLLPAATFPYGTLAANGLGCLVIGLLAGLSDARALIGPSSRAFLMVGLLGGFTTYSAFGYETFELWRGAEPLRALANVGGQLALGFACVALGYGLGSVR